MIVGLRPTIIQQPDNLIYKDNKLYVPPGKRATLLKESHDGELAAHDGIEGTIRRLDAFWWPNFREEVKKHVSNCMSCQKRKVERRQTPSHMRQHESFQPMEIVGFDYIGPLPETLHRKRFIIIAVDHFTRFVDAKAVKDQVAERFIRYFAEFSGRFGIPTKMVTDNAKQFDNHCLNAIREQFGTAHQVTPAGHSQGNAICERAIQSLCDKLAVIINNSNSRLDWELALPMVLLSMNGKVHSSTGYAPFELLYGRSMPLIQPNMRNKITTYDLHAEVIRDALEKMRANAISHSYDEHNQSKEYYDRKHREYHYNLNDQVLIKVKSRSAKLGPKFEGPYRVIGINDDIYTLVRMNDDKDKRRRHVSQMKPFRSAAIATVLTLCVIASVETITLAETLPIYWEEDPNHFVSRGEETINYVLHYVSPCSQLLEYANLLNGRRIEPQMQMVQQQQHNVIKTPTVMVPNHQRNQNIIKPQIKVLSIPVVHRSTNQEFQSPITEGEDRNDEPSKGIWVSKEEAQKMGLTDKIKRQVSLDQQAGILYLECENVFNQSILAVLAKWNPIPTLRLKKRQAAFITGYLISNIVNEVRQLWKGSLDSPEWSKEVNDQLQKLNRKTNLLSTALRSVNTNLGKIQQEIKDIRYEMERLPSLETFHTFLISEIQNKKLILEQFAIGLYQGKTETILLASLLNSEKFDELEARDVTVSQVNRVAVNTAQITMAGHVRSNVTKVCRVKSLSFYTNWSSHRPIRHEYVGRIFLIKNVERNCVKSVDETTQPQVEGECSIQNYQDPQLKLWRDTIVNNFSEEIRHSQYQRAGHEFVIYCWGNRISIEPVSTNKTIDTACPTFVFKLNDSYSFKTSDNLVQHTSKKYQTKDLNLQVLMDVADVHFANYKSAHEVIEDQVHHISQLLDQADQNQTEINATIINGKPVTWKHVAWTGLSSSMIMFCCLFVYCAYNRCKKSIRFPDIPRFWINPNNNLNREIEIEISKQLKDNSDIIEREIQREISRQMSDNFNALIGNSLNMIESRNIQRMPRRKIRRPTLSYIEELL